MRLDLRSADRALAQRADIEAHAHDFVEIAVVGTGTGIHLTSRGERPLVSGDVIVLRPGAWHGFRGCADLTVANCCISAQALRAELALLREITMFRRLLWIDPVAAGAHAALDHRAGDVAAVRLRRRPAHRRDQDDPVLRVAGLVEVPGLRPVAGQYLGPACAGA